MDMVSSDTQHTVHQSCAVGTELVYRDVRERIQTIIGNRVQLLTQALMDVDGITARLPPGEAESEWGKDEG